MGTKKGQVRKTARRAYVKKKKTTTKKRGPKNTIISNGKRFTLSKTKFRSKASARRAGKGRYFRVRGTRLYTRKTR